MTLEFLGIIGVQVLAWYDYDRHVSNRLNRQFHRTSLFSVSRQKLDEMDNLLAIML